MTMEAYENPTMSVSLFDKENITAGGSAVPQTALEQAKEKASELAGTDEDKVIVIGF